MAIGAAIGGAILGAGGTYAGFEGGKGQAKAAKEGAELAAAQARERAAMEERIKREQTDYYSDLAEERAAWDISVSKERTEFTARRVEEEFDKVKAAQIAGYSASGLGVDVGSPLAVMKATEVSAETEQQQIFRSHAVFTATRTKEAEEVRKGGEAAYGWFMERLGMETGWEVESRLHEASMFGEQAGHIKTAQTLATAGSLLKSYSSYQMGKK